MQLVHYYVHGRGQGHATRTAAVIERLREAGWTSRVFVGADARATFANESSAVSIESLPADARVSLAWLVPHRIVSATRWLKRERPQVVVSDGDGPGIWAARLCKVPSIAVGHGLAFSHCHPLAAPDITDAEWRREGRKAAVSAAGSTRQVAVNFVALDPLRPTTTVARPTLRRVLRGTARQPDTDTIVCYFRDDDGDAIVQALHHAGANVWLFGRRDPGLAGIRFSLAHPTEFAGALLRARGVVSSAGSQLISECVALSIPQLAVYEEHDLEQRLNVAMLRHAGLGDGCPRQAVTPQRVAAFLQLLEPCLDRPPPNSATEGADVADAVLHHVQSLHAGSRAQRPPCSIR